MFVPLKHFIEVSQIKRSRRTSEEISFTTMAFFDKDDPLLLSGLLGPVKLSVEAIWEVGQ